METALYTLHLQYFFDCVFCYFVGTCGGDTNHFLLMQYIAYCIMQDAMKFPLVGSAMLFGLFLAFKFLPKDLVNLVLSVYFILLGTLGLVATADPVVSPLVPSWMSKENKVIIPKIPVVLKDGFDVEFSLLEASLCIPAAGFCYWYWISKHWLANNVLGLAFSLQGVEHLSLGTVQNGVILLCGLFFYDIFWVFCTPVMVSVAKSFDAPIKLLFPRMLVEAGQKPEFSMLGLGDIVIPGIFVAIILRYDMSHHRYQYPRIFYSAMIGYVLGIASTIVVMNVFKAAQPALLYIVPSVLGITFLHAWKTGEAKYMYHWSEAAEEAKTSKDESFADSDADQLMTPPKTSRGQSVDLDKRVTRSASKTKSKDN